MRICPLDELIDQSFHLIFINALQQFWHTTRDFKCIGAPKKQNLLLFLNGCSITYTDKNERTLTASDGDVVYTPIGSEYRAHLSDFKDAASHTVGINFLLYGETGEDIALSEDVLIFHPSDEKSLSHLFQKASLAEPSDSLLHKRILLLKILDALAGGESTPVMPPLIAPALRYLSEHMEENPSVAALSRLCHVSEVYFRKRFKAATGLTPSAYRNALRLERARSYLAYGEISVQEISDTLGYSTVSHFIKAFKTRYGCPPLKYRKNHRAEKNE